MISSIWQTSPFLSKLTLVCHFQIHKPKLVSAVSLFPFFFLGVQISLGAVSTPVLSKFNYLDNPVNIID